ncbi:putative disease resistance protein RGA3 [Elaeis guineensis]|uniref:Disease resistance protein RGA2 n=1 Tax=Elaeis guineensis var. tenera TaxID=51953 RepID=A0A8N4IG31_ELAGV|nr:disease resistance protein RGA2 [Elaeis guineensis]
MAAEAVGASFASAVIRKLVADSLSIVEEGHLHPGIQDVLTKLRSTLRDIQSLIDDSEGVLTRDPSQAILLEQLKDVFYEADDVLDEFHFKIVSTKLNGDKKVRCIPSCFMYFKNSDLFRYDLQNLKNLEGELKRISDDAKNNLVLVPNREKQRTEVERISASLMFENEVYGRDNEKEEIVKILLSSGGEPESGDKGGVGSSTGLVVNVLTLAGMGGIGKTTLAQLVYNDERVRMHFDTRAWCFVSEDFDIKRISKDLLYVLGHNPSNIHSTEIITTELGLALLNKKFLIVFDDVWNENAHEWEMLRNILTCGARGSKVLVTTRNEMVARIMSTTSTFLVRCLSDDDSWALLKRLAFDDRNLEYETRKKLEPIGKKICRRLGGLPLATKVVGSLLRFNLDEIFWRRILEGELWEYDFASHILPVLRLSYQHLNANLRQCFAYCSIFPQGYMFEKLKLVQMWQAQGYIKLDDRGEMTQEDIGSQWFDELRDRSFFQRAGENRYEMHDLIHDLALWVSSDDCSIVEYELQNIPHRVRHLAVRTDKLDVLKEMRKLKNLRTLLFFGNYDLHEYPKVLEDMFIYLKGLRVLDLSSTPIEKLPYALGGLLHLRYLDISNTKIRLLPSSFSRLCHLQMLNLQGCNFQELPKGMNKLINLRYLYGDSKIVSLIEGIGELTNLQHLKEFPVRQKRGHGIGELKSLKNLQGRLSIKNLENVKTKEEAMEAELENKKHLNALQLEWSSLTGNQPHVEKEVLEGLQPHPNLKKLSIMGYNGIVYPDWMVGNQCLVNLVCVHLHSCHRWEHLPSFGQLPSLKFLYLENMPAVTQIGYWFYGNVDVIFPSLEQLKFVELQNLKEWSEIDSHQFFPCLREIQIKDCCSLTTCPFLSIQSSVREFIIDNCGDLSIALPGCLQSFTSLTLLVISHYHHKMSVSLSNLNALEKLHLEDCPELTIPGGLHSLANLKKLHIEGCPMLNESSLPKQPDVEKGLQSLADLCIDDSILINDGWALLGSLSSLRILNFQHFNHLGYFSKEQELWFHQLTSIQELGISHCLNLERLPAELSPLLSLKKLSITNCPKIMSLPENGLPISLKELQISGCPALGEQCTRGNGPDWPKIAHIPFITIHP